MAKQSSHADRVTVVVLRAYTTKTASEIAKIVDLSIATVNRIYARAIERGFDPIHTKITDEYVQDSPRAGRPTKQDPETINTILSKVRLDRFGREKTCADLAGELSQEGIEISSSTVWTILKKAGLRKTKPTRKPGLTKKMRAKRLAWCLAHEH
jgi:transposase